jgi:hypothetical protein
MCCFSQPVELVADTSIFARASTDGLQFLVYSMRYAAPSELAMVLPLPVPPGPPEDAVRFISLQDYPRFFQDLANGFPQRDAALEDVFLGVTIGAPKTLKVHDVGDFEASFVPTMRDFDRLDERFRIGPDVWDRVPAYRDFGFAVFKLKRAPSGAEEVHPMAFEFPRRNADLLYFPTLHVHDRAVHPDADFDHVLYCQVEDGSPEWLAGWEKSFDRASQFVDVKRTQGVVADQLCWRLPLEGRRQNQDTLVGRTSQIPQAITA